MGDVYSIPQMGAACFVWPCLMAGSSLCNKIPIRVGCNMFCVSCFFGPCLVAIPTLQLDAYSIIQKDVACFIGPLLVAMSSGHTNIAAGCILDNPEGCCMFHWSTFGGHV